MNSWTARIVAIISTGLFAYLLACLIPKLVVQGVHALNEWITNVLSGGAGLEGILKLCVYLIAVTLLIRFMTRR
jgi:hypothetical protein